mmetsp:Transcript_18809/g.46692  ORF Transcript_18809/g.46692 Transcript_18809/m.46692 type:complete len:266 (+) Transcript_18809:155-952(+)
MSIASNTCTASTAGKGKMASARSRLMKLRRGQLLLRHQNLPCLSLAFAMKQEGGHANVAARSFESSSSGIRSVRTRFGNHCGIATSLVTNSFFHTWRSVTPPPITLGPFHSARSTIPACMKKMENTQPPVAEAKSAMVEMRAASSKKRNTVLAAISLRCALCAAQYCAQVKLGGFSCRSNDTKHSVAEVMAPATARKSKMSNPLRPGHTMSGEEHAMPMYACMVATGRVRKTVSTSCMPRKSISALRCRRSLVRSARQAANAVPS